MDISNILSPTRTQAHIDGGSKKRVLEMTARLIAQDNPALSADDLFTQLINRERLGSTGIGQGIAIPHCRISNCAKPMAALMTLSDAVDFEAIDEQPVNIIFALLVPDEAQEQHLQMLASLAQTFSEPANLNALRNADSDTALFECAEKLFQ